MSDILLNVEHLKKYFPIRSGVFQKTVGHVHAVDDVSLTIERGKVLGIVGESGCGKSTTARVMTNLITPTDGKVTFDGQDLLTKDKKLQKELRRQINMVFQDPYNSLDPRMTVAELIGEPMRAYHLVKNKKDMVDRAAELIEKCGLFADQIYRYPHQFSGGQRQRICIARALAASPKFVICDEAVSALDVSIQAQIINLLCDLKEQMNLTYAFISHDLSVVRFISDDVVVMYLGQIVERAEKNELFDHPMHPYTQALLSAAPVFDADENPDRIILEGDIPSPSDPPKGCRFHTRCPYATAECREIPPEMKEVRPGHFVMCHKPM